MIPEYEKHNWTNWMPMPSPELATKISGPDGPGVYQIRNRVTKERIQFGKGVKCQERMRSLFPPPYGSGTRNNMDKRNYILQHWPDLEYRTLECRSEQLALNIENQIKSYNHHKFNT